MAMYGLISDPMHDNIKPVETFQNIPVQVPMDQEDISSPKTEYLQKQLDRVWERTLDTVYLVEGTIASMVGDDIEDREAARDFWFDKIKGSEKTKYRVSPELYQAMSEGKINTTAKIGIDVAAGIAPFLVPGVGAALGVSTMTAATGIETVEKTGSTMQGVLQATIAGGTAYAATALPMLSKGTEAIIKTGRTLTGKEIYTEVLKGLSANVGVGIAGRSAQWAAMKATNPELADEIEVFDVTSMAIDAALYGLFAGHSYRSIKKDLIKNGLTPEQANKSVYAASKLNDINEPVRDANDIMQAHQDGDPVIKYREDPEYAELIKEEDAIMSIQKEMETDMVPNDILTQEEAKAINTPYVPKQTTTIDPIQMNEASTSASVKVVLSDAKGNVVETTMPGNEAVKRYMENMTLIKQITACVRG